jgi:hypothetical protein
MDKITSQGFSLMLCWPTCDLFVRLVSLHNDTERKGKVTEVDGTRCIVSIDNKPAATVYNEWTDGSILKSLGGEKLEGNVLAASTWYVRMREGPLFLSFSLPLVNIDTTTTTTTTTAILWDITLMIQNTRNHL